MKISVRVFPILLLMAALVLMTSGCGGKSPTGEVTPSPSISAATEENDSASAATSQCPVTSSAEPAIADDNSSFELPEDDGSINSDTDYSSLGWSLMEKESLGGIHYRMCECELIALIGTPETMSETVYWGADGFDHTDWYYPSKGLIIGMIKQPDDVEASVFSIEAKAPCDLSLERGIKIGDSYDAIKKAYPVEYNPQDSAKNGIVLGTLYGGIILYLDNGVVSSIFIGAAAE